MPSPPARAHAAVRPPRLPGRPGASPCRRARCRGHSRRWAARLRSIRTPIRAPACPGPGRPLTLLLAAQVAGDVSARLPPERLVRGRNAPLAGGRRTRQRTVRERVVITLDNVVEAQCRTVVACDREADRIGPVARGKARAGPARVSEIARVAQRRVIGAPGLAGNRAADAGPALAEWKRGASSSHLFREKIRAGHFGRYSITRMSPSRLESLKSLVAQNPADSFLRYGLAMEYRNTGDLESAMREFRALMEGNPDYAATYLHAGQTLERMGRVEDARAVYQQGIEVTA